MKKMLLMVSVLAVGTSSVLAVPAPLPSPFLNGTVNFRSGRINGYGRDVYLNSKRVFRSGDMVMEGKDGKPAQLSSKKLAVSAQKFFFSRANGVVFASQELSAFPVEIQGTFAPRSNRNTIRLEVSCERAKLTRSVWTLEGKVTGFYEDGNRRQALNGEKVKLSAFDNAVSIVQDGAISLSAGAS